MNVQNWSSGGVLKKSCNLGQNISGPSKWISKGEDFWILDALEWLKQ